MAPHLHRRTLVGQGASTAALRLGRAHGRGDHLSDLDHVLWIGGAAGAGKTTVARLLARRRGLHIYASDNRTWEHRDRALASGSEPAHRWEMLSPAARLAAPVEEQLAMALVFERRPMIVEDLRALPRAPLVVAEGTILPPEFADPDRSVWLLPTAAFQARHRFDDLQRHVADLVGREARRYGIATIVVDGSRSASEIADEVERRLAGALDVGPVASSRTERRALLREANLAAVEQVRGYCARPWSNADPAAMLRSFVCECGDRACDVDPIVPAGVAAAGPVFASGHSAER